MRAQSPEPEKPFAVAPVASRKRKRRSGVSATLVGAFLVGVAGALRRAGSLGSADYRGSGTAMVANGATLSEQVYSLHSLRVGDRIVHDVPAAIAPKGSPLLLGQNFLKRFKSWSIDNRRRLLRLQN